VDDICWSDPVIYGVHAYGYGIMSEYPRQQRMRIDKFADAWRKDDEN